MNINQLKYVLEVSSSSSMREASAKLFVSQPALSASIRELEEEIGIQLFQRRNNGVVLTEEGREFVTYAKKAVGQYESLESRYLYKDKYREKFSVSTQHFNFAIKSFTNVIKQFNPQKYMFSIHETKTKEVLENVRDMKSEVGIVSYSGTNKEVIKKLLKSYQLEFYPLMIKETYVYVWKDNALASRTSISLDELTGYPCISFDQSGDNYVYLTEEAMADYDFEKLIKSDDRATTMELIADLNGYSVGSGMLSGDDVILQGLVSIKLEEEDPLYIGYITRKGAMLSEFGQAYVQELLKYKEE